MIISILLNSGLELVTVDYEKLLLAINALQNLE